MVTIIGAGDVARRKAEDLLEAGALIRVVSPEIHPNFSALKEKFSSRITMETRPYQKGDLKGSVLVFSATDNSQVNRQVYEEAMEENILINAVDDPPNCSFFIASMYRKGDLLMTLSTSGASPSMAARLRRELQKHIPQNIDIVLASLRRGRELLKSDNAFGDLDFEARGAVMKCITSDDALIEELGLCEDEAALRVLLRRVAGSA